MQIGANNIVFNDKIPKSKNILRGFYSPPDLRPLGDGLVFSDM